MARMNQTKKGQTRMNIKVSDLVLDTFRYGDENMQPLYIMLYVMEVTIGADGKQTVRLAPPHYKNLSREPAHDFTLDEVAAECNVIRSKQYQYFSRYIYDADGKKVGMCYESSPADGSRTYAVMFRKDADADTTPQEETIDERMLEDEKED